MDRCLERDGAKGVGDEYFWRGATRFDDRLMGYIDSDGNIDMQVTTYVHVPGEEFDSDAWEAQSCYLSGKATKGIWETIYRISRALAKHGKIKYVVPGKDPVEIVCDGSLVEFYQSEIPLRRDRLPAAQPA